MEIGRRQLLVVVLSALTGCGTERRVESASSRVTHSTAASTVPANTRTSPAPTTSTLGKNTLPSTSVPARTLEVIERAGWQAAAPGQGMIEHVISHLTVHHTAVTLNDNREAPARLRAHQRFHQTDRGWPDLAYHFAIDQQGNIYEGRSPLLRATPPPTTTPPATCSSCWKGTSTNNRYPTASLRS